MRTRSLLIINLAITTLSPIEQTTNGLQSTIGYLLKKLNEKIIAFGPQKILLSSRIMRDVKVRDLKLMTHIPMSFCY
jgi:hypothetical protein